MLFRSRSKLIFAFAILAAPFGANGEMRVVDLNGEKVRVIQERNIYGAVVKQIFVGRHHQEIVLDYDGNGTTDHWEVSNDRVVVKAYAFYRKNFSRLDVEQRLSSGTLQLKYYFDPRAGDYRLLVSKLEPYSALKRAGDNDVGRSRVGTQSDSSRPRSVTTEECDPREPNLEAIQRDWRSILRLMHATDIDERRRRLVEILRDPSNTIFHESCRREPFATGFNAMTEAMATVMVSGTQDNDGSGRPTFLRCMEQNGLGIHAARMERSFWVMLDEHTGPGAQRNAPDGGIFGGANQIKNPRVGYHPIACRIKKDPDHHGSWFEGADQIQFHRPLSDYRTEANALNQYALTFFHESIHASALKNEDVTHAVENCCGQGLDPSDKSCQEMRRLVDRERFTQQYEAVLTEVFPGYLDLKRGIWDAFSITDGDTVIAGLFRHLHERPEINQEYQACKQNHPAADGHCDRQIANKISEIAGNYIREECDYRVRQGFTKGNVNCDDLVRRTRGTFHVPDPASGGVVCMLPDPDDPYWDEPVTPTGSQDGPPTSPAAPVQPPPAPGPRGARLLFQFKSDRVAKSTSLPQFGSTFRLFTAFLDLTPDAQSEPPAPCVPTPLPGSTTPPLGDLVRLGAGTQAAYTPPPTHTSSTDFNRVGAGRVPPVRDQSAERAENEAPVRPIPVQPDRPDPRLITPVRLGEASSARRDLAGRMASRSPASTVLSRVDRLLDQAQRSTVPEAQARTASGSIPSSDSRTPSNSGPFEPKVPNVANAAFVAGLGRLPNPFSQQGNQPSAARLPQSDSRSARANSTNQADRHGASLSRTATLASGSHTSAQSGVTGSSGSTAGVQANPGPNPTAARGEGTRADYTLGDLISTLQGSYYRATSRLNQSAFRKALIDHSVNVRTRSGEVVGPAAAKRCFRFSATPQPHFEEAPGCGK